MGIEMAKRLGGEIVSADSRQVYHRMDIGTAKPTPAERTAAPHHLIDVVEPDEEFSLALYQRLAMEAIEDITARGKMPILVGGTGQYLAAVLEGWNIPQVPPQLALRQELEEEAQRDGEEILHARLAQIDPQAAQTIPATNVRRVIRALEVYEVTGTPISELQTSTPPPYDITTYWIQRPTDILYQRIDDRVDAMMRAGLLDEVQALVERGYSWELPALSSLGYLQFRPYFAGEATETACIERLKYDTHRFARRQKAWFRRLPGLHPLPL